MEEVEIAVIGAGVVGLACAAKLASAGREVIVIERHRGVGQETSSRNSGVIHAGLYYPKGSLKARLCARGRALLYARAEAEGIPHRRLGKVVVATEEGEEEALHRLLLRGLENGAGALRLLDPGELAAREPGVRGRAALYSPESGIVEAHGLLESYRREALAGDAAIALGTEIVGLEERRGGLLLATRGRGGERDDLWAAQVVNAAGLGADRILELAGLDPDALGLRLHPCKGDYFRLASSHRGLCRGLVYPLPSGPGLGVHITPDLGGELRAGPDATYIEAPRYDLDPSKAVAFARAIGRYLPGIEAGHLSPDYAGVRPKLSGPREPPRDFVLRRMEEEGLPSLISAIGIESPGLTAAGAIAEHVYGLISEE